LAVRVGLWGPSSSQESLIVSGDVQSVLLRRGGIGFSRFALKHSSLAGIAFLIEFASIAVLAIATGIAYHLVVYGEAGVIANFAAVGILAGLGYALAFLVRDEYGIESLLEGRRDPGRIFLVWNLVFVGLAVIGFLTKGTQIYSRGWVALFYAFGFVGVVLLNSALTRGLTLLIANSWVRRRKMMIVATDVDLAAMEHEIASGAPGFAVVARVALPHIAAEACEIDNVLEAAVANARAFGVEDVIISNELSHTDILERTVQAFSSLMISVHLNAGGLVGRFKHARFVRFGRAAAVSLTRAPLGPFEAATKRWMDIFVSGLALILLSPLFAVIAFLIKCDTPGPVFFKQRRRGYNMREFKIWKFRTMTTLDDGDTIKQASKGDERVTAIGRFLRRTSLDELPQLINVLKGEMSLVGPRPHAVAHDRFFESRIADYPRRLNVKPGITGWAQVNGFRGATDTDDAMRRRVEHDLFYIENCSIGFDFYILLLTVISPKASHNAH
jgi:Undecaprenyl-phosphate glucose phosphotransferase